MSRNHGFGLVELMIALAIGTIVMLVVTSLLITNQRTSNLQTNLAEMQQQGMLTLDYMVHDIQKAGYANTSFADNVGVLFSEGESCDDCVGSPENSSDRLTLAYDVTDDGVGDAVDCEGNDAAGSRVVHSFWLDDSRNLRCSSGKSTDGVVLLEGVASFQVLYGVDTKTNGKAEVVHYSTAEKMKDDWQVAAVRIGFIVERDSGETERGQQNYRLLDKALQTGIAPLDRKNQVRRQFTRTIPMRNFHGGKI